MALALVPETFCHIYNTGDAGSSRVQYYDRDLAASARRQLRRCDSVACFLPACTRARCVHSLQARKAAVCRQLSVGHAGRFRRFACGGGMCLSVTDCGYSRAWRRSVKLLKSDGAPSLGKAYGGMAVLALCYEIATDEQVNGCTVGAGCSTQKHQTRSLSKSR